jgi:hypothetical protein
MVVRNGGSILAMIRGTTYKNACGDFTGNVN